MKKHPNNNYGICNKCGGQMKKGVALNNLIDDIPYLPGSSEVVTVSMGKRAKIVLCAKCTKCGYSTSLKQPKT